MPRREDEYYLRKEGDLRYCVFCGKYLSPIEWAVHPHNPEKGAARKRWQFGSFLRIFKSLAGKLVLLIVITLLIVAIILSATTGLWGPGR